MSKGSYKRIFAVLFQLTKLVNSGASLQALLEAVSQAASELVGAETCSIMLLDETGRELLTKASSGLDAAEEQSLTFKIGEGVAGWVAQHASPALIPDTSADARFKKLPAQQL